MPCDCVQRLRFAYGQDAPTSQLLAGWTELFTPRAHVSGLDYPMILVSEMCRETSEEAKSSLVAIAVQIGGPGST